MTTQQDCSIGLSLETTFGTIVAPSKFLEFTDEDLDWMPTFTQGQGMRAGSRIARAARRGLGRQMAGGPLTVEACSKGLGILFAAALGAVTTTQRGATGVFQQVHTPAATDYLNSYTLQKGIPPLGGGAAVPHTLPGAVCGSLTFTAPNNDIATVQTNWVARGMNTSQAYAPPSYPTPVELFEFAEASLMVGGTVVPPTTTALATGGQAVTDVLDFAATWDNALDDGGFGFGGAGQRSRKPATGDSALTGTLTAEFDNTTLRDIYLGQLDVSLLLNFVGTSNIGTPATSNPQLQLWVPDVRFEGKVPKSNGGQVITQAIPWTGLDNLANPPLTVVYASTDTAP